LSGCTPKRLFKSIAKIKTSSVDELLGVKGISLKNAEDIYNYFHKEEQN
jgi:ERCC4-type nuclease